MPLICSLFDRSTNFAQTASRILAVLCGFAGTLAVESLHAADAVYDRTLFADIIDGVDSSILDVGPDTARIALTLEGEHLVFKRDSHQQLADGMIAWSGKNVQDKDATSLFIAKNGDDSSIKLVKGDFEYDITKDGRGDYELHATDLKDTVVDECLTDSDPKVQSAAGKNIGTDSVTTSAAATTLIRHDVRSRHHIYSRAAIRDHRQSGLHEGGARAVSKRKSTNERFCHRIDSRE